MKPFYFLRLLIVSGMILFSSILYSTTNPSLLKQNHDDESIVLFTPPVGWHLADSNQLPSSIRLMVIGKGQSPFPPSLNLATQPYDGTLKQYLKIVKSMNDAQGANWKDLGMIRTEAGNASLSQVDRKTEWGDERLMHVILLHNKTIYILTASALKEEFSHFYQDFFAAMRSLKVSNDLFEMIKTPQRRNELKLAKQQLQNQWQSDLTQRHEEQPETSAIDLKNLVFQSAAFQANYWTPFKEMVSQKFADLGPEWQALMLQKTESELFNINI